MQDYVTYEAFGAVGDGKTDDQAAIVSAHAYANEHKLPVKTKPDAVYYIGKGVVPAVIRTDTDWQTSRFVIDDVVTDDYRAPIFSVPASEGAVSVTVPPLHRGQEALEPADCGLSADHDYYVTVYNDEKKQYIRWGLNQDSGSSQTDSFILTRDGKILSGINWDYDKITRASAQPIDETPLTLRGGSFTTIANQAESKYTYYGRGISITRSNVTVENVYHTVTGEIDHGAPYGGFYSFSHCYNCVMKNCFVTGHKIYNTIGSAGKPVSMGSYDINTTAVIGITFDGCRQDDICNRTLWGVFGSNFCKQITFDHCVLSRSDAHCGVRDYVIRNSVMGWMGTNTIGFGKMLLENVTCYCGHLIGFRDDYGCTWDGDLTLRNVTWIPQPGTCLSPVMFWAHNRGQHDFGYPCTLPHHITIENVFVVDSNVPDGYDGIRLFSNFHPELTEQNDDPEPFPLSRPESVTVKNFRCLSGKQPVLCDNMTLFRDTKYTVLD